MFPDFSTVFRNPDDLLALEPEDLAGILLEMINSLTPDQVWQLHKYRVTTEEGPVKGYARERREQIQSALAEAWHWLEREGMIAPKPNSECEHVFVTRRGKRIKNREDLRKYRLASLLPKELIHPGILEKVNSLFISGDYETAVFRAFKELEVTVMNVAGLAETQIGVDLMRMAFHPDTGALSDQTRVRAERESVMHLFAGAIGSYKNPSSHRDVKIGAAEAVELLMFSSHLLRIVDARTQKRNPST